MGNFFYRFFNAVALFFAGIAFKFAPEWEAIPNHDATFPIDDDHTWMAVGLLTKNGRSYIKLNTFFGTEAQVILTMNRQGFTRSSVYKSFHQMKVNTFKKYNDLGLFKQE